jgi:hypothetical protein
MTYAQQHTLELPNQPRQKRIRQNRDQKTVCQHPHKLDGCTSAALRSLLGGFLLLHERALNIRPDPDKDLAS